MQQATYVSRFYIWQQLLQASTQCFIKHTNNMLCLGQSIQPADNSVCQHPNTQLLATP